MKFAVLPLAMLLIASSAWAARPSPATQPVVLPRSEQFDIESYAGQTHRIFVAAPKEDAPSDGYAVLYVLDANAMFLTAVEAVRFQHGLVPTVVVGIGYPIEGTVDQRRRYRDFSPVTPAEQIRQSASGPPVTDIITGGEDEFLDFIENTLKPQIATRFPVSAKRQVLLGHSLAGRLVLHAMFTRAHAFSGYVAASPSIWWNERSILREADAFLASRKPDAAPVNLLITVGEMEQRLAPGTPAPRAKFLTEARMVDNSRELARQLNAATSAGVRVELAEFTDENHGSVVPPAISRAVRRTLHVSLPAPGKGNGKPPQEAQ